MDFSSVTSAVDATTVVTTIIAIGALTIVAPFALTAVRWLKSAVRSS